MPEGEIVAIKQIEKNLLNQVYCVTNHYHDTTTIYPFYNPHLKRLLPADNDIIDAYENKSLAFPVVVKVIN